MDIVHIFAIINWMVAGYFDGKPIDLWKSHWFILEVIPPRPKFLTSVKLSEPNFLSLPHLGQLTKSPKTLRRRRGEVPNNSRWRGFPPKKVFEKVLVPRKIGSPAWLRSLMKKFLIPLSAVCRDLRLDYFYWISFVFFSLTFFRFEFNIWKFPPPFICGCLLQAASFRFRFKHFLSRRKIPEHIRLSENQIFAYLQMCVLNNCLT